MFEEELRRRRWKGLGAGAWASVAAAESFRDALVPLFECFGSCFRCRATVLGALGPVFFIRARLRPSPPPVVVVVVVA